jgi:hypothetical protein
LLLSQVFSLHVQVPPLLQPLVLSTRRCMELAVMPASASLQPLAPSTGDLLHIRHFDENVGPLSPLV